MKKWYKLKPEALTSKDPMLVLFSILFEALSVRIEDVRLERLPPLVQFLFEEAEPPKVKKAMGDVN